MGRGPTKEYHQVLHENYELASLSCLKTDVIKSKISTRFPLVMNIEPTNACQARCYYCPRESMIVDQGVNYLSLETFKGLIDQITNNNKLIMLNLHKDGESLLHKDLPKMVEYAKQKDAADIVHLNTNGILLNSKVGRGIIESGIDDITVSIDAAYEETYRENKKLKNLKKLEDTVKQAIEFRDKINSSTLIRVKIIEFKSVTKEEIELFHDKWRGVADVIQVTGMHSWSGGVSDVNGVEVTNEQKNVRHACSQWWFSLAINSNGLVSPCSLDWNYSGVIGDINKQSIEEIWNGKQIKGCRNNQLAGIWDKPKVCEECVEWVPFKDLDDFYKTRKEFL